MSDHYNTFSLKHFAGLVADCMSISLLKSYAPGIPWVSNILLGLFFFFFNRQIPWSYNKLHDTLYLGGVISAGLLIYGLGLLTLERKYFSLLQPLWKRYLQKR